MEKTADYISESERENMVYVFEELLSSVNREGIDRLLDFIRKSDFYTAPASTKYHDSCRGGLLRHSLQVYGCLDKKTSGSEHNIWREELDTDKVANESIIIAGLLHDICKVYFYGSELKNQKTYDPDKVAAADRRQVKHDNNGDFIWETVPAYTVEDRVPYGHGEKSVMMIEEYIKLKPVERYAIRWHIGFTEPRESWNTLKTAIEKYPLVLALVEADLEAVYIPKELPILNMADGQKDQADGGKQDFIPPVLEEGLPFTEAEE